VFVARWLRKLHVGDTRRHCPRAGSPARWKFRRRSQSGTVTERRQVESELERLAGEQAALRRVATLVAEDVPSSELFGAVAREVGTLLGADFSGVARFEDDTVISIATWAAVGEHPPVPPSWQMQAGDPATAIAETSQPVRWDDWTGIQAPIAALVRDELGVRSTVGCPIVVGGRVWGALAVHSKRPGPLPPDTESRIAQFSNLVGTAIANAEARTEVERLADEQAALRRVATLVAREASEGDVFASVTEEAARVLGTEAVGMLRFEPDGTATLVAQSDTPWDPPPLGTRFPLDGENLVASMHRTGHAARVDNWANTSGAVAAMAHTLGVRSSVATPIVVEGRLWGTMIATTSQSEPLPAETETRIGRFIDLVATAIANAEARAEVERLAKEQAALRRVATLVAEGAAPAAVFDAVAGEMEILLDADQVALNRFEPRAQMVVLAHRGLDVARTPVGSQVSTRGESVTATVRRTRRPARMEHYEGAPGALAELARETGLRASVGAPIVVDGRLWGIITASWKREESPPAGTEERMSRFAELLDTAIANADSRDQLTASRARLVAAGDEARRRVVRDLHDGAQQRLVHTIVTLKLAQRALRGNGGDAESLVGEALEQAEQGNAELRELAHGILPAVLTRGGLRAGVDAVVARLDDLRVQVDVPAERFPAEIEASAYFIVAEALTNVVKHAHANVAEVRASVEDGTLHVEVRDDGKGGADPHGHGLVGLDDRANALGGRLEVESPARGGTLVTATLPLSGG
jgi:signal transduction histidine kinase